MQMRELCENTCMPQFQSSLLIFAVFAILAAVFVLFIVFSIADKLQPWLLRHIDSNSALMQWFESVHHKLPHHRSDTEDESDDLQDSTAALLSMLDVASVVVDESDEVVRASPEAYTLAVVGDDSLVDARVIAAVHEIREKGGSKQLDVTTDTPQRFFDSESSLNGGDEPSTVLAVTRPNWLKVTVGRIDEHFVVVLLDDISEAIRFGQVRESFISNVSEQLVHPTQALEQLADSLEHDNVDKAQVKADAKLVRRACRHLSHMVSDLLLLIKAQEPITPSAANRLNVFDQLEWVAQDLQSRSQQSGVSITVAGDTTAEVNGERDQIRTAVSKLVENAIDYSPKGSTVSVVAAKSADNGHVIIRVLDRGSGINPAEQSRIFERFYRGGNQSERTAEGIGLGLAIVKHVALTHHGSATVWSAPGQGSTFSLTLPEAQQI